MDYDSLFRAMEARAETDEKIEEMRQRKMAAEDPRKRVAEEIRAVFSPSDDGGKIMPIGRMAKICFDGDDEPMTVVLVSKQPSFGPEIRIRGVGALSFVTPESGVGAEIAKADGPGIVSISCPDGNLSCAIYRVVSPEKAKRVLSRRIFAAIV